MSSQDLGKLLLRLTVGGLMLLHGIAMVRHGVGGIRTSLTDHGLPAFVAYGVYLGEVVAPVLLILGWLTRPAALVFAINMMIAVYLAHAGDLFHLKSGGYALELQALYAFGALAIALIGSGRYAVSRGAAPWN